ncbi:MAG: hypothetical protein QM581_05610 [Pseudomonas sp.]
MPEVLNFRSRASGRARPEEWRWLAPVALLVLGFCLVPLLHVNFFRSVPGDLGDARFNGIILEHFYRWLTGQEASLLSPGFFYPMPGALTFSDNHWGTAWVYSIYRGLGFDRYIAFNLWYLTGYLANFLVMHLVLRRFGFSPPASAMGAFLYAFAMPVGIKAGHAQLVYRCLAPIALLCWQRFRVGASPLWLGWCALAVAGQFYISIYLGYFLCLLLLAWAVAQIWVDRPQLGTWLAGFWRGRDGRALALAALMVAAAALLVAVLMYPYIHYSRLYGFQRDIAEVTSMLPRIRSYFLADGSSIWHATSEVVGNGLPMRHEQQMFVGVGALLLSVIALALGRSALVRVAAVSLALLVVVTIDIKDQSFYLIFADLPGVNSIRAVSRIILLMLLPLSILVASGIDTARNRGGTWIAVAALLCFVLVTEAASVKAGTYDIAAARQRAEDVMKRLPADARSAAVVYVPGTPSEAFYMTELDGMLLAQQLGAKTLNGYSGNNPPGYFPDVGQSPCVQAQARMDSARTFYRDRLKRDLPAATFAGIAVLDQPQCKVRDWSEIPFEQLKQVHLQVTGVRRTAPSEWMVTVQIDNGSRYTLQSAPFEHALRLSWQVQPRNAAPSPAGWNTRVEVGQAQDIAAGQSRVVEFPVRGGLGGAGDTVYVSLVQEARTWLHERGVDWASAELYD